MDNICVYCASSMGNEEVFADIAKELAALMVKNNKTLVYGGACCGIMGVLASEVLSLGGKVHGIMPRFFGEFEFEVFHTNLTKLDLVDTMNERKYKMIEVSDMFITLPGSYGTMDELFETLTLLQLKQHNAPVYLVNVDGFYDNLLKQLDVMCEKGVLTLENLKLLRVVDKIADLPIG